MMGVRETIQATLKADTALMALLVGDVWTGVVEIGRTYTPEAFDAITKEVLPCALIKMETDVEVPPFKSSSRSMMAIYLYQRVGYDVIVQAADRIYTLLNRVSLAGMWEMRHTDTIADQEDQALQASLMVERYQVIRAR